MSDRLTGCRGGGGGGECLGSKTGFPTQITLLNSLFKIFMRRADVLWFKRK